MENFPSNSHETKDQKDQTTDEQPKRILKVVEGDVQRRKKPMSSRFLETFLGEDSRSVAQYVVQDVLLPAFKDMVADAVSQGFERLLFGETRSASRRTGTRPSGPNGPVSYNRFSSGTAVSRPERTANRRGGRSPHNFDEIIIPTRAEADEVIEQLFELLEKYRMVSVSDLFELVGEESNFTDEKWGWTSLRGAGVSRVREGYVLNLPRTEALD